MLPNSLAFNGEQPPPGTSASAPINSSITTSSATSSPSNYARSGWSNAPPPPLHLAPYPPSHPPLLPLPGTQHQQSQLICSGCRTLLVFPQGATNVRCALCSCITPVPPYGSEMDQLVCGGCRTLLMYISGATSVQCSCCHTVNVAMDAAANQVAHVNCGGCNTTLVYAYGAQSVKCALCQFITPITIYNIRFPMMQRPAYVPCQSQSMPQTVVVENPMTVDDSGNLVSNVAVGVATDKT